MLEYIKANIYDENESVKRIISHLVSQLGYVLIKMTNNQETVIIGIDLLIYLFCFLNDRRMSFIV